MAKITVVLKNNEEYNYDGPHVKPQVAPGAFLVAGYDGPVALFNMDFVKRVDISYDAERISN